MAFLETMRETFESGDPTIRSWALVDTHWTPIVLCTLYVFFIKRLGPAIMKNREPFDLRMPMIIYNFTIVAAYVYCLVMLVFKFLTTDAYRKICTEIVVSEKDYTYVVSGIAWYIYVLKYLEFADTVFFILRKKDQLVTNLHLIHHTALPIICWVMLRVETSGFQMIPAGINSFVHVIMYTYYGLAAMGPEVQKKLWWKEYLTLLQMGQFIVILLSMFVVIPLLGCKTSVYGMYMDIFFATLFFALFFNFYMKTYKNSLLVQKIRATENGHKHKHGAAVSNGSATRNAKYSKES